MCVIKEEEKVFTNLETHIVEILLLALPQHQHQQRRNHGVEIGPRQAADQRAELTSESDKERSRHAATRIESKREVKKKLNQIIIVSSLCTILTYENKAERRVKRLFKVNHHETTDAHGCLNCGCAFQVEFPGHAARSVQRHRHYTFGFYRSPAAGIFPQTLKTSENVTKIVMVEDSSTTSCLDILSF